MIELKYSRTKAGFLIRTVVTTRFLIAYLTCFCCCRDRHLQYASVPKRSELIISKLFSLQDTLELAHNFLWIDKSWLLKWWDGDIEKGLNIHISSWKHLFSTTAPTNWRQDSQAPSQGTLFLSLWLTTVEYQTALPVQKEIDESTLAINFATVKIMVLWASNGPLTG